MTEEWITTVEACRLSGYHSVTMRKLLLSGRVKGRKWSIFWQVSRASLLAYVRQQQKRGKKPGRKPKSGHDMGVE